MQILFTKTVRISFSPLQPPQLLLLSWDTATRRRRRRTFSNTQLNGKVIVINTRELCASILSVCSGVLVPGHGPLPHPFPVGAAAAAVEQYLVWHVCPQSVKVLHKFGCEIKCAPSSLFIWCNTDCANLWLRQINDDYLSV